MLTSTSLRYLAGTAGPSGFGSRTTAEEVTAGCVNPRHITAIITGTQIYLSLSIYY
jgi:retinol dehydrogenase 12